MDIQPLIDWACRQCSWDCVVVKCNDCGAILDRHRTSGHLLEAVTVQKLAHRCDSACPECGSPKPLHLDVVTAVALGSIATLSCKDCGFYTTGVDTRHDSITDHCACCGHRRSAGCGGPNCQCLVAFFRR